MTGIPFIWDGVPSEFYNLGIVSINEKSYESESGSGVELVTGKVFRNAQSIFYDAKQSPVLEFPLEIISESPIELYEFLSIKDWLTGDLGYKKLQICIDGMETLYFNCKIHANKDLMFNGYNGFSVNVECDSPWAWEFETSDKYTFKTSSNSFIFNNYSADSELMFPTITFTVTNATGSINLINRTLGKEFDWKGLQYNETLYVDCKNEIIKSSTGLRRMDNFKSKWYLRFAKGANIIDCVGSVDNLTITYQNARRLGGGFY